MLPLPKFQLYKTLPLFSIELVLENVINELIHDLSKTKSTEGGFTRFNKTFALFSFIHPSTEIKLTVYSPGMSALKFGNTAPGMAELFFSH